MYKAKQVGMTRKRFSILMKGPVSLTPEEAFEVIENFKKDYPQVYELMDKVKRKYGIVKHISE